MVGPPLSVNRRQPPQIWQYRPHPREKRRSVLKDAQADWAALEVLLPRQGAARNGAPGMPPRRGSPEPPPIMAVEVAVGCGFPRRVVEELHGSRRDYTANLNSTTFSRRIISACPISMGNDPRQPHTCLDIPDRRSRPQYAFSSGDFRVVRDGSLLFLRGFCGPDVSQPHRGKCRRSHRY